MPLPSVSVVALSYGNEADGSPVVFKFERTGDVSALLSIDYRLFGTAKAGSDYTGSTTGTISFAAGSATASLSLPALSDSLVDPSESIIARISPSIAYAIIPGKQTSTATITAEGVVTIPKNYIESNSKDAGTGEVENSAYAILKNDGSVITFGTPSSGGDSSSKGTQLSSGVCQVFSNPQAFAALKINGSVVTWGSGAYGGDSSSVSSELSSGVKQICSTYGAFAALKSNGSVIVWGYHRYGGSVSNFGLGDKLKSGVTKICAFGNSFAALKTDGSVVFWGMSDGYPIDFSRLSSGVTKLFTTGFGFAALKTDGSIVTWGGADGRSVNSQISSGVIQILSNGGASAALQDDGSVITWGSGASGGDSSSVSSELTAGVMQIYSSGGAFAALKSDGSVIRWGFSYDGDDSSSLASQLSFGVTQIFTNGSAFAALKEDGSVLTWGDNSLGGDSTSVSSQLKADVTQISSVRGGFAALKSDGSVVTWGSDIGGFKSLARAQLSSDVTQILNNLGVLKSDGSVVFWSPVDRTGLSQISSGVVGFANINTDDRFTPLPYTLTLSEGSIWEGSSLTTTVSTTNVASGTTLYWTVSGVGVTSADFYSGALMGSGEVGANGKFSFSHGINSDLATEGEEILQIKLFSDSARTLQVGSTSSVKVKDVSLTPGTTYVLTTSISSINEGSTLTTNIFTTNVASGTTLYWFVDGVGVSVADFSSGTLMGSGVVGADGKFSFVHAAENDLTTEGEETLQIRLFSDSARTIQVGSTASVTVEDTSMTPPPTYSLIPSSTSLFEGSTLTTSVVTTNVASGTTFYWSIGGAEVTTADLSAGSLMGSGVVGTDGKFSFVHTASNDFATEGEELLQIKLFSDSARTIQVGSTASVKVKDVSLTPGTTYTLTPSDSSIDEGSTLTNTITTTNVASGTTLYWSLEGIGIGAADLSSGSLTGSGTVGADGKSSFYHTLANDLIAEGDETLQIKLFSDSALTVQVGETASVTIKDTSLRVNTQPSAPQTLTGSSKVGRVLTADKSTIVDPDGVPTAVSYGWEVSTNGSTWTKLTSADATDNNSTYALTAAELGKTVRSVIAYTDQLGTNETVSSAPTSVVLAGAKPTGISLSKSTFAENVGPNVSVAKLSSVDLDTDDAYTYSLVSGTGSTDNSRFSIAGDQLVITGNPDFESKNSYSIRVRTTDLGGLSVEKSFALKVTNVNEAPIAINLSDSDFLENIAVGSVIGNLGSIDPDRDTTFTYSLTPNSPRATFADNQFFSIVNDQLKINASANFEQKDSYTISVRSTDTGKLFYDQVLTLVVQDVDEAPTDISITGTGIDEGAAVGSLVGSLVTTDQDESSTDFTYELVAGNKPNNNDQFETVGDQLKAKSTFNFETKSSYLVNVRTTDEAGLTFAKSIVVKVNNVNENPTDLTVSATAFNENVALGATVATLGVLDPDKGDTYSYSFVSGEGDKDNQAFLVAGNALKVNVSTNFEVQKSYAVRLRVTDQGGLFFDKAVSLGVNNQVEKVSSAVSTTLAPDKDTLELTGTKNIFATGNQCDNTIAGNSGRNKLIGGLGKDILTGGAGVDTFFYNDLKESLLVGFDVITDYAAGEKIIAGFQFEGDDLITSTGKASALNEGAIGSVLTNTTFLANNAAAFTVEGLRGTFLALNDGRDGFQADTDGLIHLSNYTIGSKTPISII